jgi:hypothetical protein
LAEKLGITKELLRYYKLKSTNNDEFKHPELGHWVSVKRSVP